VAGSGGRFHDDHRYAVTRAGGLPGFGAATLCEAFQRSAAAFPDAVALREPGDEEGISWAAYAQRVRMVAAGLAKRGVGRGDTVALMLRNRPEFHIVDVAALHLGAVPFSIYNTSPPGQIEYLFSNARTRVLVTEPAFLEQVRAARVPALEHAVLVEGETTDAVTLDEIEAAGDPDFDFEGAWHAVDADDLATLIYTSGTTGPPKGVELTHHNLIFDWRATHAVLPLRARGRVLSYLPCAHLADRFVAHYGAMLSGSSITCVADPRDLAAALVDTRPTVFAAVPRIWEKLHASLLGQPAVVRALREHDEAALAAVRAQVGFDQLDWAGSGAAPITPNVLEFFSALGVTISEVWGMSEVGCVGTANPLDDIRIGTVGRPLPGVEVRLADGGELLLRGPNVMRGYRNDPERTADALRDGWMHTGDVAAIDADGYVTIVDRKKELIINAAGKNMSPANIERALKSAGPLIGQACVVGDRRPYNVALLVLDPDTAAGLDPEHPQVVARVQAEVDAANACLSRVEQVKRFALLPGEWLPDSDELTPTMKLKRRPIEAKYATRIEELYA
jgi:long-chain acyl-CoA synthetase